MADNELLPLVTGDAIDGIDPEELAVAILAECQAIGCGVIITRSEWRAMSDRERCIVHLARQLVDAGEALTSEHDPKQLVARAGVLFDDGGRVLRQEVLFALLQANRGAN